MTPPTQVTQNPETPTCRQNEAAKSQKPSDSAKQIGEIQKPNNSADQFGKIGQIQPPNWGGGGVVVMLPNYFSWRKLFLRCTQEHASSKATMDTLLVTTLWFHCVATKNSFRFWRSMSSKM